MISELRSRYNAAFDAARYAAYLELLAKDLCPCPFRVAETPVFLPEALRERLRTSTEEILAELSSDANVARMVGAVPPDLDAPNMPRLPSCVQVDFAIVEGNDGLDGRVVELQAFPSLYAFTFFQAQAILEVMHGMPGLEDVDLDITFDGLTREEAVAWLSRVVLGDAAPEETILLEIEPEKQKTLPDFLATKALLGIDAVCVTDVEREGRKLFRRTSDGRRLQVKRIYNRVVFDEYLAKRPTMAFAFTDDLDVTWVPHPNFYWAWSKYSLPLLSHPAIPKATKVSDLAEIPADLSNYVLKPLFSFAGAGVIVDVTPEDVARLPAGERDGWILQEKITYARALKMPTGEGVAAEIRVMCLLDEETGTLRPAWNLARLSRGKMIGVDHNRDKEWVGASIGLWPRKKR